MTVKFSSFVCFKSLDSGSVHSQTLFLKRQKSFQIEIVLYENGNFKLHALVKTTILKQCKKEYYSLQNVVNMQHRYLDFFFKNKGIADKQCEGIEKQ